jgi:putative ABC transport system permease protein
MSYAVAQRTRDFAIRMAIGAQTATIFRMVTRDGLVVAITGIALGLLGAFIARRALMGLLYGVMPTDGPTMIGASAVVLVVALVACWIPARRAARVDPLVALRYE